MQKEERWFKELDDKRLIADHNVTAQSDYEKALKKYQALIKKQNSLLRVAFHLLYNLSDDKKTEFKMVNKGIINLLVKTAERESRELLLLVVKFLKKLSIYVENKNAMKELDVIEKLSSILIVSNDELIENTLRLIYNLMFDPELRMTVIRTGLFPKLVSFLSKECDFEHIVYGILYHISQDDNCKAMFSFSTENFQLIVSKILNKKPKPIELIALVTNLALNQRNAHLLCEGNNFQKLIDRALTSQEPLFFKILRNITSHDDPMKMFFLDYIDNFFDLVTSTENEDLVLECLAVLGNLNLTQIKWDKYFEQYNMISWIKTRLKAENSFEDDIVLQTIVLLSVVSLSENCSEMLLKSGVLKLLIELLNGMRYLKRSLKSLIK